MKFWYILGEFLEVQKVPVNKKASNGWTALHVAAQEGHMELARYLLSKGAKVEVRDNYGDTPLFHCTLYAYEQPERQRQAMQLLIDRGSDWKSRYRGSSAFHSASSAGKLETMKFLLGLGVPVDEKTDHGLTSVHLAAAAGHHSVTESDTPTW